VAPFNYDDVKQGFARVKRGKIAPRLAQLERDRAALHRAGWFWFWAIVAGGGIVSSVLVSRGAEFGFSAFVMTVAVLAGLRQLKISVQTWEPQLRDAILGPICHHVGGLTYHPIDMGRFPIRQVQASGVFRQSGNLTVTHIIHGTRGQGRFEMATARFQYDDGETRDFEGLIYVFTLSAPAPTDIAIHADFGRVINAFKGISRGIDAARSEVKVAHSRFSQHLRMFAEEPTAADGYVTDRFLGALGGVAVAAPDGPDSITAVFQESQLFLTIRRVEHLLDFEALTRSSDDLNLEIDAAFGDIIVALRISDALVVQ